jgi:fructose-specific component phosphotransferase system IIB-like protein
MVKPYNSHSHFRSVRAFVAREMCEAAIWRAKLTCYNMNKQDANISIVVIYC